MTGKFVRLTDINHVTCVLNTRYIVSVVLTDAEAVPPRMTVRLSDDTLITQVCVPIGAESYSVAIDAFFAMFTEPS